MKYGSIWARIGGGLIDLLIVLIISSVILFFWGFFIGIKNTDLNLSAEEQAIMWKARGLLVGLLVDLIYTVVLQTSNKQATLGQSAFELIIVRKNGQRASVLQLLVRYIVSIPSSIIFKVGYLIALFTKQKQTLHDLVANTVVIEKSEEVINVKITKINEENYLQNDGYVNPESENDKFKLRVFYFCIYFVIFLGFLFVSGILKLD